MISVLKHRGPDDTGIYVDTQIGLANARLSIIDIEGGHQPQQNEDGTIHVTYNGEIYNFKGIRSELEKFGHRFTTRSDTEVIVHGYEQYGNAFPEKLNGMFAVALWDKREQKLVLARDRMGIKPLYYWIGDHQIIFASELKALLQANIPRIVDIQALYEILNLGYIPGSRTLIEGIKKLPPSSMLVFKKGHVEVNSYWIMPSRSFPDQQRLTQNLRAALQDSIGDQLVADVPVGCFLSGGLDTATIAAFASKALTQPLKTFCMGFGEETDELKDARIVAERFGTDHHELIVDSSQAVKLYPRMIWHMEAPKYNLYPWFVCELVRKYVTVCLSGNGGDEIFGGYVTRYRKALRIRNLSNRYLSRILRIAGLLEAFSNNIRIKNRARALRALGDNATEYLILAGVLPRSTNSDLFLDTRYSEGILREVFTPFFTSTSDFLDDLMRAELRTKLVDDLLSVDDSMSMAHSLELRVPFLDNRIVDLLATVPWQFKYAPNGQGKMMLREIMKDILPEQILHKPKWGFSVEVSSWYSGELGEVIKQVLPSSEILKQYFSMSFVQRLVDQTFTPKDRRYQILLWQLLGFHFWHKIFVDSDRPEKVSLETNTLAA